MMKTSIARALPGILLPPALVGGAMALILLAVNAIPAAIQSQQVKSYDSLEVAGRALGVEVSLPAYFPDYLRWPPDEITLRRKPVLMLSLSFSSARGVPQALLIHEIFPPGGEQRYLETDRPLVLLGELSVNIEGQPGTLVLGKGPGDAPFTQVHWRKGSRYLIMRGPYPPEELLRMAGSMKP